MRLGSDRRRIEEDVRAHQHHRARRLRVPLVPADAHAERRMVRAVPYLETCVPGPEVELLLIAGPVWDVALAVDAGDLSVGPDHRKAVVMMRTIGLEEAGRDPDLELLGQLLHCNHRRMLGGGAGVAEEALVLD